MYQHIFSVGGQFDYADFLSAALVDFLVVCANSSLIGGIYWGGQSLNQWNNKVNNLKQSTF